MSLSPNGLYRRRRTLPSTARRLPSFVSLQYSKLAISTLPHSIYRSRSLWGYSCFVFVHDFPLERTFSLCFSLAFFFFFLSCIDVPGAGPTKKCYCPLPLATGGKRDTAPAATDNGPYFGIACTRVPRQSVCVTPRSTWEPSALTA